MSMFYKSRNDYLFEQFRALRIPLGEYVIFGSGPMGVRKMKDLNDLDVLVAPRIFGDYKGRGKWEVNTSFFGSEYVTNGEVDLFKDWRPGDWDSEELISNAEIINGLAFASLEEVLKWKKLANRKKDQKDIAILEDYLSRNKATGHE